MGESEIPELRYVRTQGGRMVHFADCPRLTGAAKQWAWHWAEGLTPPEIVDRLDFGVWAQIRWCRYCIGGFE